MCQILIVEDEARLAAFIEKGLRKNGFTTAIAENGQQALSFVTDERFELMLLDLGLPIIDGLTVLKEIRNQGETRPVIIITARKDDNEGQIALTHGADDYVTKPFRFSDLLKRIHFLLARNS
jgi:DNA-binding response OmpR family regulator